MIYVLLLYALFACVFTISKTALGYAAPFFLVGSRMMAAGIFMLIFAYFRKIPITGFSNLTWRRLLIIAALNIYLTNICEFWGLQYLTSFKTCFIYSLSPFFSAILAYFLLQETLNSRKLIGLIAGSIGFAPVLLSQGTGEEGLDHILFFSWAELALMTAALSTVIGWIFLKKVMNEDKLPPIIANGWSMLIGGAAALIHSYFVEVWDPIPVSGFYPFLKWSFLLICVSNLICYNLYGWLLKRFTATFMSFAGFVTPFFTALFGWLFLSEEPSLTFLGAVCLVGMGLFLFYSEELKHGVEIRK